MPLPALALAALLFLASPARATPALTQEVADMLSARPGMTWRAAISPRLQGKTREQLRAMLMPIEPGWKPPAPAELPPVGGLPEYFHVYEKWPRCRQEIRDQGQCGSCWAFGALGTLQDRLCIAKWDLEPRRYSEADLVTCDMKNHGCGGGLLDRVWAALHQLGYVDYECQPYDLGSSMLTPGCEPKCVDGSLKVRTRTPGPGRNYAASPAHIQEALTRSGPLEVSMDVYSDFYYYAEGVYQHVYGELEGRHAISVVGYGMEGDLPYWIIRNSWGLDWGEEGYFRIVRGRNECLIESEAYAEELTPELA